MSPPTISLADGKTFYVKLDDQTTTCTLLMLSGLAPKLETIYYQEYPRKKQYDALKKQPIASCI